MGNGAKAQQKRDRNKLDSKKEPQSQLKTVSRPFFTRHSMLPVVKLGFCSFFSFWFSLLACLSVCLPA